MTTKIAAALIAGFLGTSALWTISCYAHDLVLIPQGKDQLVIKFGHPQEYETPDLHKLIELTAYSGGQKSSLLEGVKKRDDESAAVALNTQPSVIGGKYDNGYWISISKDRYYNTSKLSFPNGTDSGYYFKFGKALFPGAAAGAYATSLGYTLELSAQKNPFDLAPGDKLPVQVLYQGKPLANIGVEIGDGKTKIKEADIPRYQTDAQGIAQVPIAKAGLQVIAVDYEVAPLHPDLCDHDKYGATLTFVLPAKR